MLYDFIKSHKKIFVLFILTLSALFVLLIYTVATTINKEKVRIYVIPNDANIVLNGRTVRPGTSYLDTGTYSYTIEKDGFKKFEDSISVGISNSNVIDVALVPESTEALEWTKDNASKYSGYEARAGIQAAEDGQKFTEVNPITKHLPIRNLVYAIGYRSDTGDSSGNSIILIIDASSIYRKAAIDKIRDMGYDPTNFKIEFKDYRNPFDE